MASEVEIKLTAAEIKSVLVLALKQRGIETSTGRIVLFEESTNKGHEVAATVSGTVELWENTDNVVSRAGSH